MKKQTKLGLVLAAAAVISVSVASLVSAKGWVQQGADWYYVNNENEYVTETIQSSGNAKFYLGEDGAMQRDFFLDGYGNSENTYYFGSNGAMVTNTWVAIEASRTDNQGDYVPDNYWYYFQASGKAMKGTSGNPKKATIDGKKYLFNEYGQMCTGWVNQQGEVISPDEENPFNDALYYCGGDNDGALRAGWVTYYDGYDASTDNVHADKTNLYFYFNTTNNKKLTDQTKKINGRTYAFDGNGIMLSGWDVFRADKDAGITYDNTKTFYGRKTYWSGEDDGHQVKKGWVYAVPAESIDSKKHEDDEEAYMYFDNAGLIVTDQIKKVNGKWYAFNRNGIMQTGLVMWAPNGVSVLENGRYVLKHFITKVDRDYTTGEEFTKMGRIRTDSVGYILLNQKGEYIGYNPGEDGDPRKGLSMWNKVKFHLFGEDGARKTGSNTVEFADDNFSFVSNNAGDKGSGVVSKKYYSLGVLLKASADIKMGMYNIASPDYATAVRRDDGQPFNAQQNNYYSILDDGENAGNRSGYIILNTSGSKIKGANSAKKDADGNYWYIDKNSGELMGIWSKNVKSANSAFTTKNYDYSAAAIVNDHPTVAFLTGNVLHQNAEAIPANTELRNLAPGDINVDAALLDVNNWKVATDTNNTTMSFTFSCPQNVNVMWYQADYNGGSNKWIPFGVLDDVGNTIIRSNVQAHNNGVDEYVVTPNNDYFTNCYWDTLR